MSMLCTENGQRLIVIMHTAVSTSFASFSHMTLHPPLSWYRLLCCPFSSPSLLLWKVVCLEWPLSLCNCTQLIHWKALLSHHNTLLGLGAPTGTHLCPITKTVSIEHYIDMTSQECTYHLTKSHTVSLSLTHTQDRSIIVSPAATYVLGLKTTKKQAVLPWNHRSNLSASCYNLPTHCTPSTHENK